MGDGRRDTQTGGRPATTHSHGRRRVVSRPTLSPCTCRPQMGTAHRRGPAGDGPHAESQASGVLGRRNPVDRRTRHDREPRPNLAGHGTAHKPVGDRQLLPQACAASRHRLPLPHRLRWVCRSDGAADGHEPGLRELGLRPQPRPGLPEVRAARRDRSVPPLHVPGTTHQTIYFPEVKAFHVALPARPEQSTVRDRALST